ncbi:MAG: DUF1573 domain-containing protein [Bacteroidota bacterium]
MKSLAFLLLFLGLFWAGDSEVVRWQTPTEHDFGVVQRNESVTYGFVFQNISDEPIVIENIRYTCGCTAPDWTEAPIEPDSSSTINIRYKWHKKGYFRKKIKVFVSGQRKAEVLYVEGEVLE